MTLGSLFDGIAGFPLAAERQGINAILNGNAKPQKSVAEVAKEVIAGKWGNNPQRKERLEAAGYDYQAVQNEVNQFLK